MELYDDTLVDFQPVANLVFVIFDSRTFDALSIFVASRDTLLLVVVHPLRCPLAKSEVSTSTISSF